MMALAILVRMDVHGISSFGGSGDACFSGSSLSAEVVQVSPRALRRAHPAARQISAACKQA